MFFLEEVSTYVVSKSDRVYASICAESRPNGHMVGGEREETDQYDR